jgi:hypothetical protein
MAVIDKIAKELHMKPNKLLKESLRNYLDQRITKIEADLFLIAKKYGVKDVFDLDKKIKEGLISEEQAYEDYFTLDNLENEREKLKKILENL